MYFKRGPEPRAAVCKIYPLLLFQLVIRGDAGLVKNRIMYAPDINGRRLFSAGRREERGWGGREGGRGNKSGIPPRGKRGRGNRVEIRRRIVSVVALVKIVGNRTIERRGIIIFLLLQFRFFSRNV